MRGKVDLPTGIKWEEETSSPSNLQLIRKEATTNSKLSQLKSSHLTNSQLI